MNFSKRLLHLFLITTIIFAMFSTYVQADNLTSAKVVYTVKEQAGNYTYTFNITNTSTTGYDIYGLLLGMQFDAPIEPPLTFGDITDVRCPKSWYSNVSGDSEYYNGYYVDLGTDFVSDGKSSYLAPGKTMHVKITTNRLAPSEIPFGAVFYNNNDTWGFGYNGVATKK